MIKSRWWEKLNSPFLKMRLKSLMQLSTGLQREQLLQWKTRDLADPAGLSPLLEPLRVTGQSTRDHSQVFLNNNSLTALQLKETRAAMEDGHLGLLTTSRLKDCRLKHSTPTLDVRAPARCNLAHTRLDQWRRVRAALLWPRISKPNRPQFVSTHPTGHYIAAECSATAEPTSTTPFLRPDGMPTITGSSKTLGEHHGDRMDISLLKAETLAEFAKSSPMLIELNKIQKIFDQYY